MGLLDCWGLYASVTGFDGRAFVTADKAGSHTDVYRATPASRDTCGYGYWATEYHVSLLSPPGRPQVLPPPRAE